MEIAWNRVQAKLVRKCTFAHKLGVCSLLFKNALLFKNVLITTNAYYAFDLICR
jgi:hypothetical protein